MVLDGPVWSFVVLHSLVLFYRVWNGSLWSCEGLYGLEWSCEVLFSTVWSCTVMYVSVWSCMVVFELVWSYMFWLVFV